MRIPPVFTILEVLEVSPRLQGFGARGAMPGTARPTHLWSDEDFALPRGRFRTYQRHHVFKTKARPRRLTRPVPLKGVFAGLSPKRLLASAGSTGTQPLRAQAQVWNEEAAKLEKSLPTLTLAEQIGQGLGTHQINIRDLVQSWDGEGRGSIVKSEFRTRCRGLLDRLGLMYPGPKPLDAMYDEHDAGICWRARTFELSAVASHPHPTTPWPRLYNPSLTRVKSASHDCRPLGSDGH